MCGLAPVAIARVGVAPDSVDRRLDRADRAGLVGAAAVTYAWQC
jgi:hypothetical protein